MFAFFLDLAVALSPLFIIAFGSTASNAAEVTAFALGCLYFAARDSMFGRSIGKFLFGLRVIDAITSTPCSPVQAVKRDGLPLLTVGAAVLVTYLMSFIVGDDIAAAAGAVTILAAWVAPFAGFGSGRFRTLCDSIAATYVVSNRVWIASKAA